MNHLTSLLHLSTSELGAAYRLSTATFRAAVLDLNPAVAVFDCDGTLWSGDAGSAFMTYTIETGLLSREATDWLDGRYRLYKHGEVSELAICGEMVQVYAGLKESELRRAATDFFRAHVAQHIFPEMKELVAELQARGSAIWAVSSTNNWVIEEGVRHFGIPADHVLAAQVQTTSGTITNTLLDVPTDAGKVTSLARAGIAAPDAVFGNSVHDAAMLAIGRRAFPVNPTSALIERSIAEGWPIYFPASVAPVNP